MECKRSAIPMYSLNDRLHHRRNYAPHRTYLLFSLLLNGMLLLSLLWMAISCRNTDDTRMQVQEFVFHGGHPEHEMKGSCVCQSEYCMCNPALAIDLVIRDGEDHILLVRRRDTDQLATMGGFVQIGETVEEAIHRELYEEMRLTISTKPILLGVYSDPRRDNRRHTASAAFVVQIDSNRSSSASAADDAKEIVRLPIAQVATANFFSDHKTIINDYLMRQQQQKEVRVEVDASDNFDRVKRSLCPA